METILEIMVIGFVASTLVGVVAGVLYVILQLIEDEEA